MHAETCGRMNAGQVVERAMSAAELGEMMKSLRKLYDRVQLVEPEAYGAMRACASGAPAAGGERCYWAWSRTSPCPSCAARSAMESGGRSVQLQCALDGLQMVTAICLNVEGRRCVLELTNAVGGEELAQWRRAAGERAAVSEPRLYADAATGLYNHRYYEERLRGLDGVSAVALMNLGDMDGVHERYGQMEADAVLRQVGRELSACVRKSDSVLRYGAEDFLLVFQSLPRDVLPSKLEGIRSRVERMRFDACPELSLKVSIGGKCGPGRMDAMVSAAGALMCDARSRAAGVCIEQR